MEDKHKKYTTALKWEKENAIRYSIKLMKTTDLDIIEYMEDKPIQATIKKALRMLIKSETENN